MSPKTCLKAMATFAVVAFCAFSAAAGNISGITNFTENATFFDMNIASNSQAIVKQNDCDILFTAATKTVRIKFGSGASSVCAYLLESGNLTINPIYDTDYTDAIGSYGSYFQFRQTGGNLVFRDYWYVDSLGSGANKGLRTDFIFGGSGIAKTDGGRLMRLNDDTAMVFNDSVRFTHEANNGNLTAPKATGHHVWVYNGGVAEYGIPRYTSIDSADGDFFAFNGGVRSFRSPNYSSYADQGLMFGSHPRICVYERGGGIHANTQYIFLSMNKNLAADLGEYMNFCDPKDYVITSIPIPADHELRTRQWDAIPAVVITDANGTGSNAVAVADFDWDTRTITNITVFCGGEGYSACSADDANPAVTANLKFSRTGEDLLSESLACNTVGGILGGDFTFSSSGTQYIRIQRSTNYCHGAVIVDMDQSGRTVNSAVTQYNNTLMIYHETDLASCFPNATNVILKSGGLAFLNASILNKVFPSVVKFELYGGYFSRVVMTLDNIMIGGKVHFIEVNRSSCASRITIPSSGTLGVDVACMTNGVTPSVNYGNLNLKTGAKVKVTSWKSLPMGGEPRTILDLSNTIVNAEGSGNGVPETPDYYDGELTLSWELDEGGNPIRLLARRHNVGMFLIVR